MSRVLNHIFVVVVAAVCIAIGTTIAWSNLAGPAPSYASKADFDQAFADAFAGQRELSPAVREKLRSAGSVLLKSSPVAGVNREHKTGRLPKVGAIPAPKASTEPLADCEPLAASFADPVLGRIIGRCFV